MPGIPLLETLVLLGLVALPFVLVGWIGSRVLRAYRERVDVQDELIELTARSQTLLATNARLRAELATLADPPRSGEVTG